MTGEVEEKFVRRRLRAVLRDVHFWIPAVVLILGLVVLRWIGRT